MSNQPQEATFRSPAPELLNVSANHAGLIARELAKRGVDVEPIFAAAGLELPKSNNPTKRLNGAQLTKLLKLAIEATQDATIGLKIYQEVQLADLDALGFAISCSTTYLSLLQRFQRFSKWIMSAGALQIIEEPDGYLVMADIEEDEGIFPKDANFSNAPNMTLPANENLNLLIETFAMGFIKLGNDICQGNINPIKVYFPKTSHPLIITEYKRVLPTSEFHSAPFFGAKFGKDIADKRLPMANPEMARLNDEIIIKHLEEIYQNDVVFRVESLIREGLAIGEFSRSDIAIKLGMSERRLQQRLEERDTSFSDILLRIRKTLAMQYIREDKMRINQIAYALGFTNGSNFTRSFKSWTGYTPNEFKEL